MLHFFRTRRFRTKQPETGVHVSHVFTAMLAAATALGLALPGDVTRVPEQDRSLQRQASDYASTIQSAYAGIQRRDVTESARLLGGTDEAFRGWEFAYLENLATNDRSTATTTAIPGRTRPTVGIRYRQVCADPVRPRVALPCSDGTVRLVQLLSKYQSLSDRKGTAVTTPTEAPLLIAGFSSDGSTFAAGDETGSIHVWNAATFDDPTSFLAGDGPVINIAVAKSGARVAAEVAGNKVAIWDPKTGEQIKTLGRSFNFGRPLCFSPDGKHLALGGMTTIEIFDAETGEKLKDIGPHAHYVMNLAFSPDGSIIASGARGSLPKSIALFDVETGRMIVKMDGHTNGINSVAFSSDGKRLISSSVDGTLRFWHVPTGVELLMLDLKVPFGDAQFSADGQSVIWASRLGFEFIRVD